MREQSVIMLGTKTEVMDRMVSAYSGPWMRVHFYSMVCANIERRMTEQQIVLALVVAVFSQSHDVVGVTIQYDLLNNLDKIVPAILGDKDMVGRKEMVFRISGKIKEVIVRAHKAKIRAFTKYKREQAEQRKREQ